MESGKVRSCSDFSALKSGDLMSMFRNERAWGAMKEICSFISSKSGGGNEMKTLNKWAAAADPFDFKNDHLGRIKGVGISTFQYLRMQSGIDAIMPDKQIMKWINRNFSTVLNAKECILRGKEISVKIGMSQTGLCWAIWIKESGELNRIEPE